MYAMAEDELQHPEAKDKEMLYLKSNPGIIRISCVGISGLCGLLSATDRFETELSSTSTVPGKIDGPIPWAILAYFTTFLLITATFLFNFKQIPNDFNVPKTEYIISLQVVEYCVTMFCCYHTVLSTTAYVSYDPYDDSFSIQRSMVIAFGYILAGLMVADAYFNKDKMPETIKYVLTPRGPSKVVLCFLLPILLIFKVISGYRCAMDIGCDLGRVTSFALIIIFMLMQVIIFLVHVTGVRAIKPIIDKYLDQVDFICSSVGFILFLQITVVTGVYIKCWTYDYNECRVRLVGVLMALITAVVFAIDFVIIKRIILEKSPKPNGTGAAGANS